MRLNATQVSKVSAAIAASAAIGLGAFLSFHESGGREYSTPYRDSGGIWTVCDGVTGKGVIPGKYYSEQECDVLNKDRQNSALVCASKFITVPITRAELVGWASVCYNIGWGNFQQAQFVKLRNAGNRKEACESLKKNWHRGGNIPHLLDGRREDEVTLICGGV